MAISDDAWMEPPCPDIVCLRILIAVGAGGRLLPSCPACVLYWKQLVGHYGIQEAVLDGCFLVQYTQVSLNILMGHMTRCRERGMCRHVRLG